MAKEFECPLWDKGCYDAYVDAAGKIRCKRDVDRYGCTKIKKNEGKDVG